MDTREKTISKTLAYRGSILNLRIDKVEIPGGRKTVREVVEEGVQETVDLLKEFDAINEKFAEPMSDEEMNCLLVLFNLLKFILLKSVS